VRAPQVPQEEYDAEAGEGEGADDEDEVQKGSHRVVVGGAAVGVARPCVRPWRCGGGGGGLAVPVVAVAVVVDDDDVVVAVVARRRGGRSGGSPWFCGCDGLPESAEAELVGGDVEFGWSGCKA